MNMQCLIDDSELVINCCIKCIYNFIKLVIKISFNKNYLYLIWFLLEFILEYKKNNLCMVSVTYVYKYQNTDTNMSFVNKSNTIAFLQLLSLLSYKSMYISLASYQRQHFLQWKVIFSLARALLPLVKAFIFYNHCFRQFKHPSL